jgi:hypothetical protein
MPKGMKVIFSRVFFCCGGELTHNRPSAGRLSQGVKINILRTVRFVKLKLTGIVMGVVELTARSFRKIDIELNCPLTDPKGLI